MDISLQIASSFQNEVDPDLIEQSLKSTLRTVRQVEAGTITVVITDRNTIRQLNRQYRGIDAPTDVLSFENAPDPDFPDDDPDHLGDIIIAYPVAAAQAQAAGRQPHEEVALLVVHGALHLLGFDHDTPDAKEEMWAVQRHILSELDLGHLQPTET
jgi:probable rRNA maturation factor